MKSVLEHRDQVVARVVAWHNRHPLAQRITPDQVHSVGVVSLPFAVQGAVAGAPEADAAPQAAAELPVDPPLVTGEPADPAGAAAAPAAEAAPADEAGIEAVVELDVDPAIESESTSASASESEAAAPVEAASVPPAADDATAEAPSDVTPPSILDRALDAGVPAVDRGEAPEAPAANTPSAPSASPSSPSDTDPAAASPAVQAGAETRRPAAFLPARLPRWHPLAWWAALRGRAPFHALFSEDFIAPLRPRRVARWVAAHGVAARPLAAHDPCRQIALDPGRRRAGDASTEVDLHVITAAIGVEDRRHRLLLTPDGRVLGRRQWDRGRMATTAGLGLATIFGLGLGLGLAPWLGLGGVHPHADPVEAAASAPAPVASGAAADDPAATAVAHAASAVSGEHATSHVALAASAGEADANPAAVAASATSATSAASDVSGASVATAGDPRAAPRPHDAHPVAPVAAGAQVTSAADATPTAVPVAAGPASVPASVSPQPGRVVLSPLVPRLADAQREAARTASRSLRKEAPVEPTAAPDAKAWALVSRVMTNRRLSERAAAQLQAVALLQPVPMRAELLASDGGWRAVFWPFPSVQDAEKVRLALADKGLPLAVVEF